MASPFRGTAPSRAVSDMRFGDHLCLPYDNDEERRAVLFGFVTDGLRDGQKVLYVSDGVAPEEIQSWLEQEPGAGGFDFDDAVKNDDLVIIPAESAYLSTGRFDPDEIVALFGTHLEMAVLQGHGGLRLTCEKTFSLRGWPGSERFAEFEEKIEHIFQSMPVSAMALCQYDTRWFGPKALSRLLGIHRSGNVRVNDVYDDGTLRITPTFTPPGLSLHGTIEESTGPELERALRDLAEQTNHLCLDLSDVRFCDMAGLRTLLDARISDTGRERQLLLREVPAPVVDLLRVAGWENMPGVFVEEA